MANFNLADYETVDSRIKRFYDEYPNGRIVTQLVSTTGDVGKTRWVVKAFVFRDVGSKHADGTGYAFENDGEGMANKTSALENCETSAIGRALANIGYSGDKRASKEEMAKTQTPAPAQTEPPEGWRALVAEVNTVEALQALYESDARNWYTPEVKLAFTGRKKLIEASAA